MEERLNTQHQMPEESRWNRTQVCGEGEGRDTLMLEAIFLSSLTLPTCRATTRWCERLLQGGGGRERKVLCGKRVGGCNGSNLGRECQTRATCWPIWGEMAKLQSNGMGRACKQNWLLLLLRLPHLLCLASRQISECCSHLLLHAHVPL